MVQVDNADANLLDGAMGAFRLLCEDASKQLSEASQVPVCGGSRPQEAG
jgi:hypothetical protein